MHSTALGLDFGTTNTVVALTDGAGGSALVDFAGPEATGNNVTVQVTRLR